MYRLRRRRPLAYTYTFQEVDPIKKSFGFDLGGTHTQCLAACGTQLLLFVNTLTLVHAFLYMISHGSHGESQCSVGFFTDIRKNNYVGPGCKD